LLLRADAVFASHEDVDAAVAAGWAQRVPVVVYTEGHKGARLWHQGKCRLVPALPVAAVDPTGAGDAFAAAFLVRWHESGDAWQSARFATACASFVVEAEGAQGVPTRRQIEARLAAPQGS
ncbi:MAG: PfkB family carbohydrate kinase, partial [Dehalococcoidia bacterium]